MKYYFSLASLDIVKIEHEYDKGKNVLKFEACSSTPVFLHLCVDIKLITSIVQWYEKGRETLEVHDGSRVMIQLSCPNSFALEASRMYILFSFLNFVYLFYILSFYVKLNLCIILTQNQHHKSTLTIHKKPKTTLT